MSRSIIFAILGFAAMVLVAVVLVISKPRLLPSPCRMVVDRDLHFAKVGESKSTRHDHATRGDWIVRKYTDQISLDCPPSTEFASELVVSHPDDPARLIPVRVVGEESLPFRVTPRHLKLRAMGDRPGRLIVKPAVAGSKMIIATELGDTKILIVRPVASANADLVMFDVWAGPAPIPGDRVVVSMEGRPDRAIVSVEIEAEGRP